MPDDADVLNGFDNPVLAELAERLFAEEDFPSNYLHPDDRVSCSFCGQSVLKGEIDPVSLRITARADYRPDQGGAQVLYCHAACLEATGCRNLEVTKPDYWRETDEDESEAPKPHDE